MRSTVHIKPRVRLDPNKSLFLRIGDQRVSLDHDHHALLPRRPPPPPRRRKLQPHHRRHIPTEQEKLRTVESRTQYNWKPKPAPPQRVRRYVQRKEGQERIYPDIPPRFLSRPRPTFSAYEPYLGLLQLAARPASSSSFSASKTRLRPTTKTTPKTTRKTKANTTEALLLSRKQQRVQAIQTARVRAFKAKQRRIQRELHVQEYRRVADRVLSEMQQEDERWTAQHQEKVNRQFATTCGAVLAVGGISQAVVVEEVKVLGEMARWCAQGDALNHEVFTNRVVDWHLDPEYVLKSSSSSFRDT